jgi:hypothetical protein
MIREGEFGCAGDDIGAQLHLAAPVALSLGCCQRNNVGEEKHEARQEQGLVEGQSVGHANRCSRRFLRRMYECVSGKDCPLSCSYSEMTSIKFVHEATSSEMCACSRRMHRAIHKERKAEGEMEERRRKLRRWEYPED